MINTSDYARFWSKVDKAPGHGPNGDCWVWKGYPPHRYGQFYHSGGSEKAMHISLEMAGFPRPDGMICLHSCDNRPCVNPAHLRWGTYQDNSNDAKERNRIPKGRVPANARYMEIIEYVKTSNEDAVTISRKFGVSRDVVYTVWRKMGRKVRVGRTPKTAMEVFSFIKDSGGSVNMSAVEITRALGQIGPGIGIRINEMVAQGHLTKTGWGPKSVYTCVGDGPLPPPRVE